MAAMDLVSVLPKSKDLFSDISTWDLSVFMVTSNVEGGIFFIFHFHLKIFQFISSFFNFSSALDGSASVLQNSKGSLPDLLFLSLSGLILAAHTVEEGIVIYFIFK